MRRRRDLLRLGSESRARHLVARTRQFYDFGLGRRPCEFVFVPAHEQSEEDEGWLIGFVIDAEAETTDLVILDARSFEGVPQARIHLPHIVPPGFHGNWLPTATDPTRAS